MQIHKKLNMQEILEKIIFNYFVIKYPITHNSTNEQKIVKKINKQNKNQEKLIITILLNKKK